MYSSLFHPSLLPWPGALGITGLELEKPFAYAAEADEGVVGQGKVEEEPEAEVEEEANAAVAAGDGSQKKKKTRRGNKKTRSRLRSRMVGLRSSSRQQRRVRPLGTVRGRRERRSKGSRGKRTRP